MERQFDWLVLIHVDPAPRLPREPVEDDRARTYLDDEKVSAEVFAVAGTQLTRYTL